ncbi:MAG: hypothetical protein M3Y45_07500 [Actinomycetota bacterium]|nr:hypothetical protein [Actinomycetota bacterium]
MNAEDLLDFTLGQLDASRRREIEEAGRLDPDFEARAERARRAVGRLLDDGLAVEPPPGLAVRTIAFVAQRRVRGRSIIDYAPTKPPFRWADFAVAASIFVAGALTLLPAVHRTRERMNQAGCVANLQQIGRSLALYASTHSTYPAPPSPRDDSKNGLFAALLHDPGALSDPSMLNCPSNGAHRHHITNEPRSFERVVSLRGRDPAAGHHQMVSWDYGYNVGHRRPSGQAGPLSARPSSVIPVVADQPPPNAHLGVIDHNSLNHGGAGQNVLYSDGAVRWHSNRRVSPVDHDLYLNNDQKPEPGLDENDSVILPKNAIFGGYGGR